MRNPHVTITRPAAPLEPPTMRVTLGGLLGDALSASQRGRLSHFITDKDSPAIALFKAEAVSRNLEGDWYGEHAGKWLYAAAKAASRSQDSALRASVMRVADGLVSIQGVDGYLGTYAPEARFMHKQPRGPQTWNGAPSRRTWDVWNHACLILGLLEVHKHFSDPRHLSAARRIGDLCWQTLTKGGIDITELGLHHGMSATVMLDAAVELFIATADHQYLDLATLILEQANRRPELELLKQALAGTDAAEISTGKAYQLCWNMVGVAKLHKATGNAQYLRAAQNIWASIREHHLTLGGGPWGGVGLRSREVFNHQSIFSPHGYVETCSILAWIQLNRELLAITNDAKYAEEIETAAYNDLLGACAPNGDDWCYYSFPNGKRVYTTYWRCCKSSGAMALEELPAIAYAVSAEQSLVVNLYGAGQASLPLDAVGTVRLEQMTDYPFGDNIRIVVRPERPATFAIKLRIPSWATGPTIHVNGIEWKQASLPGTYAVIERAWKCDDMIELTFPMRPSIHRKVSSSVQESTGPDGAAIRQEVMHIDYFAITRGPLVYATGLIDDFKFHETICLPAENTRKLLDLVDPAPGQTGPAIRLNLDDRPPLLFHPYFEAGGRKDGAWRLTWMELAPARAPELQAVET